MNNLEFRAWLKKEKKLVKVLAIDFQINEIGVASAPLVDEKLKPFANINGHPVLHFFSFDEVIIEQYTGLKDKNGKKIYEGDIVEVPTIEEIGNVDLETLIYQKIVYEETMFLCKEVNQTKTASNGGGGASLMCFFVDGLNEIKVVGNIHENPELLGKK